MRYPTIGSGARNVHRRRSWTPLKRTNPSAALPFGRTPTETIFLNLAINMERGRPTDYSDKILKEAHQYLKDCEANDAMPQIAQLAYKLDVSRKTLYNWGKGKKNIGKNIKTEMKAGRPKKQAIAIALNVSRKKK